MDKITTYKVLDALEKPIVAYIQDLLRRSGNMTISEDEAKNIISNLGLRIYKNKTMQDKPKI